MTDRSFVDANRRSRDRLARLVSAVTPEIMTTDLGAGWTVASALGHMGFWDNWQRLRWNAMLAGEWKSDSASVREAERLANDAMEDYWARFAAADAPRLALDAATALDDLIATVPDALAGSIEGTPDDYLLHRHRHRDKHLDHIDRSIAAAASNRATAAPVGSPAAPGSPAPAAASLDRSYLDRNRDSLAALREVFSGISAEDMQLPSGEGLWTVGQLVGHIGFWERFNAARWRAALAKGSGALPLELPPGTADVLNDAQAEGWASLASSQPLVIMAETVASAEALDQLIAHLPDEVPVADLLRTQPRLLDRSLHRQEHLAQVRTALSTRDR